MRLVRKGSQLTRLFSIINGFIKKYCSNCRIIGTTILGSKSNLQSSFLGLFRLSSLRTRGFLGIVYIKGNGRHGGFLGFNGRNGQLDFTNRYCSRGRWSSDRRGLNRGASWLSYARCRRYSNRLSHPGRHSFRQTRLFYSIRKIALRSYGKDISGGGMKGEINVVREEKSR